MASADIGPDTGPDIGPAPVPHPGFPHVHILMCTWNGAAFLPAQLQSFLDQTHRNWSLWVRDDGSTDDTLQILADFQTAHPDRPVQIIAASRQTNTHKARGSAANFLSLLAHPALPPGHAAFADQDDVWLPHKLDRGLAELARIEKTDSNMAMPAIYASRTVLTDAALRPRGLSPLHPRAPGFGNALVQNVLGGNTILLNPAAVQLLRATCGPALKAGVPFHDWWIYLVLTGVGGAVFNDPEPGLLYRQHDGNVLGTNLGARNALARISMVGKGQYAGWLDRNLTALAQVYPLLTPDNRQIAADFAALRQESGPLSRLATLRRLGLYRQTRAGDLLLRALALFNRL